MADPKGFDFGVDLAGELAGAPSAGAPGGTVSTARADPKGLDRGAEGLAGDKARAPSADAPGGAGAGSGAVRRERFRRGRPPPDAPAPPMEDPKREDPPPLSPRS